MAHDPVFFCQLCRAKLNLTGLDEAGVSGQGFGIDESFIDMRQGAFGGHAAGPRSMEESFVVLGSASMLRSPGGSLGLLQRQLTPTQQAQLQAQQRQAAAQAAERANQPGQSQQAAAAAAQQQPPRLEAQGSGPREQQQQQDGMAIGLDAKLRSLSQIFEIASLQTQVDHPLCLDCEAQLKDEIEAQIQESEREVAAYSEAVSSLERHDSSAAALPESAFSEQMRRLAEQEMAERQRATTLKAELATVQGEAEALAAAAADLDALEGSYWHDFSDYQLQLRVHVDERDGLLNKIDRASQRLQLLRNTNVFNDAFKIWHDGPFGTISGFRLGRTSEVPVEWDETNAAWGQAVLLLYTMAQACGVAFSYKLMPMGSHPRVSDKHATYDLFGPVNKLWSHKYDRAMICYLACLREFGLAAHAEDVAAGKPEPFRFPFPLDGDKVNNYTIKLTLNSDSKWTKALKFMLANLKVALQWMVKYKVVAVAPTLTNLGHEGPSL
ncbi:hypothetical protein FOA52_014963 [Chlamydomonas sp. UWO 241]|nr:hypothetical protein FOA52_014963 [Chlamydomonas sp. UWO 241]